MTFRNPWFGPSHGAAMLRKGLPELMLCIDPAQIHSSPDALVFATAALEA
jgi:hypothetical protein